MEIINKIGFTVVTLLLINTLSIAQSNEKDLILLVGFNTTGSEFVFWDDNTYGGNVQVIKELVKFGGGFSAIGFKASGLFADGMLGGYGGLNFRVDEPFFFDFDALIGYSSVTNPNLLKSYDFKTTEYNGMAFVSSLGIGYRLQNSPLLFRLAYSLHLPFGNNGLNTGLNFQLGYIF